MSSRMAALVLALVALLTPTAAGDVGGPMRPLAALVDNSGGGLVVMWVPGGPSDSFRVYGVLGDTHTLLAVAPGKESSALVPLGFETYAVSAIWGGLESTLTYVSVVDLPCVTVMPSPLPPTVSVDTARCTPKVKVRSLPLTRAGA